MAASPNIVSRARATDDQLLTALADPSLFATGLMELDGEPVKLDPWQGAFLRDRAKVTSVLKSRRVGGSWAMALKMFVRTYLAVLYKTLGATRRNILLAEFLEFGFLGLATSLLAVLIATITAWALCTFAFDIDFVLDPWAVLGTIGLALTLVLAAGAITTWRVLSAKAAPI